MADVAPDPEASPGMDDTQPLLQRRDSPGEPSPSLSVFQSVVQWTQAFRMMPVLTRTAVSGELPSPIAPEAPATGRQSAPALPNPSPFAPSPRRGTSTPGSPSRSGGQLPKSQSKNDLEAAALRRINSVCSDGSGLKRFNGSCIICMETLTPEEFSSGEAITLECMCKGDMALRHKSCAVKWAQVKGSNMCDVCKAPIANLPPVPVDETLDATLEESITIEMAEHMEDVLRAQRAEIPAAADYVFDCIRVTWVSMIICILFFEFPVGKSFMAGLMVGIAYTAFCKAMHRSAQYRALANTPDSPHAGATLVMA